MARQTSAKASAKRRKPTSSKAKAKNPKYKNHPSKDTNLSMVQYEIAVMLILACALFLMISIYLNGGGLIGGFIRSFVFGAFGVSAWLLPISVFTATFLKVFNKGNERLNMKIIVSFMLIAVVSVFAHIMYVEMPQIHLKLSGQRATFASLANYYHVSATYLVAGGFIGGLIGDAFLLFLGRIGAYAALIVIAISFIIVITEQSFLMLLRAVYKGFISWIMSMIELLGRKSEDINARREEKRLEREMAMKAEQETSAVMPAGGLVSSLQPEPPKKKKHIASLLKSTILKEDGQALDTEAPIMKDVSTGGEQPKTNLFTRLLDASDVEDVPLRQDDAMSGFEPDNYEQGSYGQVGIGQEELGASFPAGDAFEPVSEEKPKKPSKSEVEKGKKEIEQEILEVVENVEKVYKKPPMELLKENRSSGRRVNTQSMQENAKKLEETLASFGVGARVIDVSRGPSVTRYELQPDQGVKVSKIVNLTDDIALNLAANGIRIEAPIPGKSAVGIEVPNKDVSSVYLREVLETSDFEHFPSKVAFGLGKDISGKVIVTDIARMPHLLIAGATGSGKSVCVNTLITSILYKSSPEDVKLLMIDPKVVELSIYNGIPHLLIPVVTDPKKAASALNWAVQEMLDRYKLFAEANVRDIKGYNKAIVGNEDGLKKLPQIVIIVDELADLMVAAAGEVEEAICRLAQMARAAGLHLVIATQRPSVDVITGLIKANIPSRIAFNVSSGTDSRTIIDMNGAEKLLGKGDMLFYPVGLQKPVRIQGAFVSDKEIENIVTYLKDSKKQEYDEKIMKHLDKSVTEKSELADDLDPLFEDALALCVDKEKASASMIQRRFRVGYNRAARILDQLYDAGYVGDDEGSKPRRMLLSKEAFEALKAKANGDGSDASGNDAQPAETASHDLQ